jgi:type VI secretion system protein ImpF
MADKTISERLQPSLLDRLTDLEPEKVTEPSHERVIDLKRLREIVRRDLAWLMNCADQETVIDPELYPHAARSVLNYGLSDSSGVFSTGSRIETIRKSIHRAIAIFEPRLKEGTLEVVRRETENSEMLIEFDIRADMWAQPLPLELFLRSQVDITTGQVALERVG